eukprot:c47825_g1_i1.p1 GENE.c47825_g1_i1~~c47825_g1_i1.p1  ORF type:complete len:362 (+),score=65.25 c47825_g1_i1:31-1086(+)
MVSTEKFLSIPQQDDDDEEALQPQPPPPNTVGTKWQALIFALLVVQTTSFVLVRRYSAAILKETYDKNAVLLAAELIKAAMCLIAMFVQSFRPQEFLVEDPSSTLPDPGFSFRRIWMLLCTSGPMVAQALLYLVQNILAFNALTYLDSGTFSLINQGKVVSTALFSIAIMGLGVPARQWRSLIMLMLAVTLISSEAHALSSHSPSHSRNFVKGLIMTLGLVMLNGFSTVLMEKAFKDQSLGLSLWERNLQLAIPSIGVYVAILSWFGNLTHAFDHWTKCATIIALMGSVFGLLVALALKYTNSIVKSMAGTVGVVFTTLFEWQAFQGPMNLAIGIGGAMVLLSVSNYHDRD